MAIFGGIYAAFLIAGIIVGIDHGLHREFFGNLSAAFMGVGGGGLGALLGLIAERQRH